MKYKFTKDTVIHILKGAGIAGGGAFSIYLLTEFAKIDYGEFTPALVALASILINAVKEWISER